jgi:hypothetical protein
MLMLCADSITRWLKIIHKMWMDRTLYDPELHHRNQLQHGSWTFQLKEC